MKSARSRFLAIIVTLAMVVTLFPASLASAAGKATIKTKSFTLQEGKTATIVIANKSKTSYSFTSSNKSVATVTKTGKITAVKAGSTSIVVKEKSKKIGTVSVKVKAAASTTKEEKAPVGVALDLSTVIGDGASFDNGVVNVKNSTFSFTLDKPLAAGDAITVTVKGKYNGSKGFRSWVIDDSQTTMSDQANTDVFPTAPGVFTATYKLTATGAATRLFFKGPNWQDANIDDVTINSITIAH